MEEYLPEELIEEFREVFSLFDSDGDGTIDIPEFVNTLRSLGQNPSQLEIEEMMRDIDANGDGMIDFEEFKHLMQKKMHDTGGSEDVKDSFMILDYDNKGYITAPQLYSVISGLGEKITVAETEEMIDELQTKQPGQLDYEEFSQLVRVLTTKHCG